MPVRHPVTAHENQAVLADSPSSGISTAPNARAGAYRPRINRSGGHEWGGRELLRLNEAWALDADSLQWIVLKARRHHGTIKWQPIAYVGSSRAVLMRVLRERGVIVEARALAALNGLPETFRIWRAGIVATRRAP